MCAFCKKPWLKFNAVVRLGKGMLLPIVTLASLQAPAPQV